MMEEKESYSVKSAIKKALINLMATKSVVDITVTELVKEAKVARVSFYRNFSSISNVVDSIAQDTANLFSSETIPPITSKDEQKWRGFLFYYLYQIANTPKDLLYGSMSHNPLVTHSINNKVAMSLENQPLPTMDEVFVWTGKLWLIQGVAKTWVSSGMNESIETMVEMMIEMIKNL